MGAAPHGGTVPPNRNLEIFPGDGLGLSSDTKNMMLFVEIFSRPPDSYKMFQLRGLLTPKKIFDVLKVGENENF